MDTVLQHPYLQQAGQWFASLNLSSMDMALIGSLIASWGALVLALSAIKRIKKQSSSTHKLCEKLVRDLHVASSGAIGMGQRIIAMERKIANGKIKPVAKKPRLQAVPKPLTAPQNFSSIIDQACASATESIPLTATSAQSEGARNPFETAKALLRRGVDQAEVARRCDLSLSETALMAMVINNREGRATRLAS